MSLLNRARLLAEDFGQYRRTIDANRKAEERLVRHVQAQLATIPDLRSLPRRRAGRNLVMGLTAGYTAPDLAPFVETLRTRGYQDDVSLVTFDTNIATSDYLQKWSVHELTFDSLPFLTMSMNSARMLKYLEFLRTEVLDASGAHRYDYILLADTRDIVFQGDPFARVDGADIYYYLEADRLIGDCPINAGWMTQAFGPEVLRQTASHRISCAGTLIATPVGLMEYLLRMVLYIGLTRPSVRQSGIDQAIHNYLMINGMVANAQIRENGLEVMTVPSGRPGLLSVTQDGRFRNPDGSFSETVHQYDRDQTLNTVITETFRRGA